MCDAIATNPMMPRGKNIESVTVYASSQIAASPATSMKIESVTFYASSQIPDMWAMTSSAMSSVASVANGAKRRQTVNCDKTYDELGSSPIVNAVTVADIDNSL